jgi:hypothetical protein
LLTHLCRIVSMADGRWTDGIDSLLRLLEG